MRIQPTTGIALVLGLALSWCGCCSTFVSNELHAQGVVHASRCYLLSIEGMSCEHCAGHVKDALLKVPGVAAAKVDYAKAQAEVCIQPGFTVTSEMLVKAVEKAGYKARVKWQSRDCTET